MRVGPEDWYRENHRLGDLWQRYRAERILAKETGQELSERAASFNIHAEIEAFRERVEIESNEASALYYAAHELGRKGRVSFPVLAKLTMDREYNGELWLDSAETSTLLEDFQRFRRVIKQEEFVKGLDSSDLKKRWEEHYQGHYDANQWEAWLDYLEGMLERAVLEDAWVWWKWT